MKNRKFLYFPFFHLTYLFFCLFAFCIFPSRFPSLLIPCMITICWFTRHECWFSLFCLAASLISFQEEVCPEMDNRSSISKIKYKCNSGQKTCFICMHINVVIYRHYNKMYKKWCTYTVMYIKTQYFTHNDTSFRVWLSQGIPLFPVARGLGSPRRYPALQK